MSHYKCRSCGAELPQTFADLGATPLANSYLEESDLDKPEHVLSLHARVCESCFLVQLPALERPEKIFDEYLYFSSFSKTWLDHAKTYAENMTKRFGLDEDSLVVEIASNDGYLLQFFKEKGVPVLGVEPAANVAKHAIEKGIETRVDFFGEATAKKMKSEGLEADLMAANNVLAHVPDINDFVKGFEVLLKPEGVATFEFPHLLNLIRENQFDTIYHEHYSYLSLIAVEKVLERQGLEVFYVKKFPTHGGSLRAYVQKAGIGKNEIKGTVEEIRNEEIKAGLGDIETYLAFGANVKRTKRTLLSKLIAIKNEGKTIAGYGAAAKGNTLLNYCGIGRDFIDCVADRNPQKQGTYLPGSRIPVVAPEYLLETKPDYVLIFPWNIAAEVMEQNEQIREWGGKFIIPIPSAVIA
ncbi:MAG: class I SAM-dependent methyltransferase [Pyrinomonadaceae bacterium]|nr:class I SAM-dependent methyltransferase [Pyrinomonadaceae bacterium]